MRNTFPHRLRKFPSGLFLFTLITIFTLFSTREGFAEETTGEPVRATDFTLKTPEGSEITLEKYRGKYLLLNFWATWCGPCKIEMPSLEALYKKFKSEKFEVLGISNDMFGATVVVPFMEAHKLSFPVALDQRLKVSHEYGVVSLPTSFLIDPEGKIIGVLQGAEDWTQPSTLEYFKELLKSS
ncbi:MAG: TlpA disulfide reductase family protein [Nitrospinota bacterium]|nr:TlpA disulfide reductase family protein [Nitrospinota bacterium]